MFWWAVTLTTRESLHQVEVLPHIQRVKAFGFLGFASRLSLGTAPLPSESKPLLFDGRRCKREWNFSYGGCAVFAHPWIVWRPWWFSWGGALAASDVATHQSKIRGLRQSQKRRFKRNPKEKYFIAKTWALQTQNIPTNIWPNTKIPCRKQQTY